MNRLSFSLRYRRLVLFMLVLMLAGPVAARGQDSPLGVRQENVRRMLERMEQRFVALADALRADEPDRAERLRQARIAAAERRLRDRMESIREMLDAGQLERAEAAQVEVVEDLNALLEILLAEDDRDEAFDEMDRLEQWRKQLDALIEQEQRIKRETDTITNKDAVTANLEAQVAALKALIEKQDALNRETVEARQAGLRDVIQLADRQADVRDQTEQLRRLMEATELPAGMPPDAPRQPAGPGGDADGKPGGESVSGKPSEDAAEGNAIDGSAEGAPSGDSGDSAQADAAGTEGPSHAPDSDSGASEDANVPQPKNAGERELARASRHQSSAEDNLAEGRGRAAARDQDQALNELKKALDRLESERDRIARLPEEAFDELADEQEETAEQAADLAKQMAEAGESQGGESGGQGQSGQSGGEGQSGQGQPGQQGVAQAQKKMQQARQALQQQKGREASERENEAIEDLQAARREVEERLRLLREQMQEEILANLETRFREMLDRQQPITAATAELHDQRMARADPAAADANRDAEGRAESDALPPLRRREQLTLAELAGEEQAIAERAAQALDIIVEDGTTVVFPTVVEGLKEDLQSAGTFLSEQQTGQYTQTLQREIERTLEELIAALEKAQQQAEGQMQGQPQSNPQQELPPLVPDSAELKLLRAAQLRVNRRTESFDEARGSELNERMRREVERIADRQAEVRDMADRMAGRTW